MRAPTHRTHNHTSEFRNSRQPLHRSGRQRVGKILLLLVVSLVGLAYAGATYGAAESSLIKQKEYVSGISDYKTVLTPARQKLSTDLLQLVDHRSLPPGLTIEHAAQNMQSLKQFYLNDTESKLDQVINEGSVYVYIYFNQDGDESILEPFDVNITDSDMEHKLAVAWVKVKELERIAALDGVRTIRTVLPPIIDKGSALTEGDSIHRSSDVRSIFSQGGSGIKVGIISDGVNSRAAAQASGDLPTDGAGLTVLRDDVGGDEGTAMLEIVHDMIPDADLYFHDSGSNVVAFNTAIDALISAGCNVVCDDIGWTLEPFFEEGVIASHVRSIINNSNIIFVSSAGNSGNKHYQGNFYSLGGEHPEFHDFSHGTSNATDLYVNMPVGAQVVIVLQWNDSFASSVNDYNLFLYSVTAEKLVQWSNNIQDGNDDPLEALVYTADSSTAGDFMIWVTKSPNASPKILEVFIYPRLGAKNYPDNITPVDSIFGHKAIPGVVAVGAIGVNNPEDPEHRNIEYFSSQGPVTISFPTAEIRQKPDVCGVDRVSVSGAGGFPNPFPGTSAAAPHIAAIMAQIWGAKPQWSADEIRNIVLDNAVDLGEIGIDNVFGHGRADALNAMLKVGEDREKEAVTLIASDGRAGDQFGKSVSVSGDYAVVGAKDSAYLFKREGSNWVQQDKLIPPSQRTYYHELGRIVSISGKYATVAARDTVHIYERSGTDWREISMLVAYPDESGDGFATSQSISGDYIIVGAPHRTVMDYRGRGSAFIFRRSGSSWTQRQELTSWDYESDWDFGESVSISGDFAIVGIPQTSVSYARDRDRAYIFERHDQSWERVAKLTSPQSGTRFGRSVCIGGNNAAVRGAGSVYIYERGTGGWQLRDQVTGSDFGESISISTDYLIVGASNSAYVFKRTAGKWTQKARLTPPAGQSGVGFGSSVSLSGDYAVVGAPYDDSKGSDSGTAYVFRLSQISN